MWSGALELTVGETKSGLTDHDRMVFLLEAARQLGSTLDESRIYGSLLSLITKVLPLDGLIVSSFDPDTEQIRCEFVWSDGQVVDPTAFPPIPWNRNGTGMQSKVILTGRAEAFDIGKKVREPNTKYVQVNPDGGPAPVQDEPSAKTALMAPMVLEGRVIGVVQAMCDRQDAYTADDLSTFESLALLMTPAWNNARTYEQSSRQRRLTDRILDTSPDIVYLFDLRTMKLQFANEQIERQLCYTEADVANMAETTLLDTMHAEDAARLPELLARYQNASDSDLLQAEWRAATKSGEWRWFLNRARVFERDADGRATIILGFATDITEFKEAESKRRESEERYRFLAELGTMIVWTADHDGTVDYVNGRWREYFGSDHVEDPVAYMHPDDVQSIADFWQDAMRAGREYGCEARLRRSDGAYRWHLCRATPIRGQDGDVSRWMGLAVDIQDRKGIEEELAERVAQRTEELEAAVKELEGFTYSVSHDLRGPLRSISAASMILREDFGDSLPEEAKQYLVRQSDAAKKMGALIDDLLKLSRLGRQELSPSTFDLSEMALDIARELGSEDRVEVQPGLKAHGDPMLVRFVLLNLIENSLKFSPGGGPIRIGKEDGAFFVEDEGVGFDMQYASKIFRPFERLVRADEYPGTGIGLANVHRIIQRHGGRIWPESELGKGSKFYFTLPSR